MMTSSVPFSKCLWHFTLIFLVLLALIGSSSALKCYVCEKIVPWCITPVCPASLAGSDGVCLSVWEQDPSAGASKRVLKGCESKKITNSTGGRNNCAIMKGSQFLEVYRQDFPKTKVEIIHQIVNGSADVREYWKEVLTYAKQEEPNLDPNVMPDEDLVKNEIETKKVYEVCSCDKDLCNPGEAKKLKSAAISGFHVEILSFVIFPVIYSCILAHGF